MSDDIPLPKRLNRMSTLRDKLEAEGELTEAEAEEYMEHTRAVNEWAEGLVDAITEGMNELASDIVEAIQPLAELAAEYEEADDA